MSIGLILPSEARNWISSVRLDMKSYGLVIFDVDGTLSDTKSGKPVRQAPDDWKLLPGRKEHIEGLLRSGIKVAFASNQGGVAFGFMKEHEILNALKDTARAVGGDNWESIKVFLCP